MRGLGCPQSSGRAGGKMKGTPRGSEASASFSERIYILYNLSAFPENIAIFSPSLKPPTICLYASISVP